MAFLGVRPVVRVGGSDRSREPVRLFLVIAVVEQGTFEVTEVNSFLSPFFPLFPLISIILSVLVVSPSSCFSLFCACRLCLWGLFFLSRISMSFISHRGPVKLHSRLSCCEPSPSLCSFSSLVLAFFSSHLRVAPSWDFSRSYVGCLLCFPWLAARSCFLPSFCFQPLACDHL